MVSVPDDVIAAARIDGASGWRADSSSRRPARPVLAGHLHVHVRLARKSLCDQRDHRLDRTHIRHASCNAEVVLVPEYYDLSATTEVARNTQLRCAKQGIYVHASAGEALVLSYPFAHLSFEYFCQSQVLDQ
jgi:hypothetical protein